MTEHNGRRTDSVMVASHLPLLARCFDLSEGEVVELGTGYFSTLLLHWLATVSKRKVYSYETSDSWYQRAKHLTNKYHEVLRCKDWDTVDLEGRQWGMAFVDHSPNARRPIEIARLAQHADYIVIHDTLPEWDDVYGYSKIWDLFKYRYDYARLMPPTTVVSNFKTLEGVP